jgi:hypothetical protein
MLNRIKLTGPFLHFDGYCWQAAFPDCVDFRSDSDSDVLGSRVVLLEDGNELNQGHSTILRIKTIGSGLYVHWNKKLYFSTSDNSDPNTNGRSYAVVLFPASNGMRVLGLGSCHVHFPIADLHHRRLAYSVCKQLPNSHTFAEHLQVLDFCRGRCSAPLSIQRYYMDDQSLSCPMNVDVESADLVFVEICHLFEYTFESCYLNFVLIPVRIREAMGETGEEGRRAVSLWYNNGFLKGDDTARKRLETTLLPFIGGDSEKAHVARAVVREARAIRLDKQALRKRLEEFREALGKPIAVATHILRFMPDGRPIIWPPEYLSVVSDVCRAADVPVINPWRLVMLHGVEAGMTELEYNPEFVRTVADEILPFLERVKHRSSLAHSDDRFSVPLASY